MTENYLPRSTPEKQGVDSTAIVKFIKNVEDKIHELHSFMLLRNGSVIAEGWWSPYAPDRPHVLFSLSKSFTSTAIGLAVAEGRLKLEDQVLSFFSEDAPQRVDKYLAQMSVHHLLCMSTGHHEDTTGRMVEKGRNWVKTFLSLPVGHKPGSHFVYNSGATYMLSAIVQKVTGEKLLDYLQPRLFEPLGISKPTWETSPQGINMGGWGLSIKTEDIARFGQLYLQKGTWNGKRILEESWVEKASSPQAPFSSGGSVDWVQGYGYQFWRCQHNFYRGDGAFGQYCIVMPEQNAVVAITSGVADMQAVLDRVWEDLLPAFNPSPLPENKQANQKLTRRLSALALKPPAVQVSSPLAESITDKQVIIEANEMKIEKISFQFLAKHCVFSANTAKKKFNITCGYEEWVEGKSAIFMPDYPSICASGTWTDENTFLITIRYRETPFYYTLSSCFTENHLSLDTNVNVAFGPTNYLSLEGKMI